METQKLKVGGIIGILVAVFLCGLPGLSLALFGVVTAFGLSLRQDDFRIVSGTGPLPGWVGFVIICVSLFMIAIPIVVGIITLRNKKPKEDVVHSDQPLPPTS